MFRLEQKSTKKYSIQVSKTHTDLHETLFRTRPGTFTTNTPLYSISDLAISTNIRFADISSYPYYVRLPRPRQLTRACYVPWALSTFKRFPMFEAVYRRHTISNTTSERTVTIVWLLLTPGHFFVASHCFASCFKVLVENVLVSMFNGHTQCCRFCRSIA